MVCSERASNFESYCIPSSILSWLLLKALDDAYRTEKNVDVRERVESSDTMSQVIQTSE
jgi:hypothetical protein